MWYLDAQEGGEVVVEALQLQGQQVGEPLELEPLDRVPLAPAGRAQVLTCETICVMCGDGSVCVRWDVGRPINQTNQSIQAGKSPHRIPGCRRPASRAAGSSLAPPPRSGASPAAPRTAVLELRCCGSFWRNEGMSVGVDVCMHSTRKKNVP